ncbi:shikimate dehydrogenase family protein [Tropicimonas isoalkanivorans]|uniref:Shikimate dehydrogenase n=1 Tax=Tropicimonas isoalkanivorans TaxID=441112 RepID=A0A1I1Q6M0_9RHOB|nr:shikimate dehydrogenase [Tropicimonas isoalkanivorans]SFD17699.1 shikimate dehydrogenase [Tropicimonas isoalkanivorans]
MPDLHLGLIGDNISRSASPRLHRAAGRQHGLDVRYDRLIPADLGQSFEEVFAACGAQPFRGLNITHPYKERAARSVRIDDPQVRRIGATNTILFEAGGPTGHNTDYTGFMAAYRRVRGAAAPGVVAMAGVGGVGRAVGFALLTLGAAEIRLFDIDPARAAALAEALADAAPGTRVSSVESIEAAAKGATALINCTPLGMVGHPGTAIPRACLRGVDWVFDAVYTPLETQFLRDAAAGGVQIVSGYELFFYQGVHAWEIFTGLPLDENRLREDLAAVVA